GEELHALSVSTEWEDSGSRLRIARTARGGASSNHDTANRVADDCVVALDGGLDGEDQPERRIAEAYQKRGVECGAELRGSFCFVLWDRRRKRLLSCSDPVGTRTIAYTFDGRTFLAATRVLSLLRHPRAKRRFDRLYTTHVLADTWCQPAGLTPFESIRRLRPGHVLVVEQGSVSEVRVASLRCEKRAYPSDRDALDDLWQAVRHA